MHHALCTMVMLFLISRRQKVRNYTNHLVVSDFLCIFDAKEHKELMIWQPQKKDI